MYDSLVLAGVPSVTLALFIWFVEINRFKFFVGHARKFFSRNILEVNMKNLRLLF